MPKFFDFEHEWGHADLSILNDIISEARVREHEKYKNMTWDEWRNFDITKVIETNCISNIWSNIVIENVELFQLAKQLLAKIYRKTVFREKNFSKTLNIEDLYGSFLYDAQKIHIHALKVCEIKYKPLQNFAYGSLEKIFKIT